LKIRPLPDIDLARIASLPKEKQRAQLEQVRAGRPPITYQQLAKRYHDIFNVQPEMFPASKATDWQEIENFLTKNCKSDLEIKVCVSVANALYSFVRQNQIAARKHEFFPLALGSGQQATFWQSFYYGINGKVFVPLIDPRSSKGLTTEGRRFAFSMMNERIRGSDPDFAQAVLAIIQFTRYDDGSRRARVTTDEGIELMSVDELEDKITYTYNLWYEVLQDKVKEVAPAKAMGSLF
jgi:hypothetical protein